MFRTPRSLRAAASLCLALHAVACSNSYVETGVPAEIVGRNRAHNVQIGRTNQTLVTLLRPVVSQDSIVGKLLGDTSGAVTKVALRDTEWAMVRGTRIAPFRTALLVIGLAIVVAGWNVGTMKPTISFPSNYGKIGP